MSISIRAPARGATILKAIEDKLNGYFNPRSREGSDELSESYRHCVYISIRAPARGATDVVTS